MARDRAPGDAAGRANIYSQEKFVEFVHGTVAMRDQLRGLELPVHGQLRPVISDDGLDRDVLWAVRKDKLDPLTGKQPEVLEIVKKYIARVNSLDYMAPFTGESKDRDDFRAHASGDRGSARSSSSPGRERPQARPRVVL